MNDPTKLTDLVPDGCSHPEIVPCGEGNWGRCTKCGEDSFPLTSKAACMPPGPIAWETTVYRHEGRDDEVHLTFKLPFKPPTRMNVDMDIAFKTPDGVAFLADHYIEPDKVL